MNFVEFACMHGLLIRDIYPSDRIKRCGTSSKPHSKNGAYFFDGERGWVMDWSISESVHWWNDPNAKSWTDEDKKAWAEKKRQAEKARNESYAKAAKTATEILSECFIDTHPYLKFKGHDDVSGLIASNGVTMPHPDNYNISIEGALVVPMRDCRTNAVSGFQAIKWNDKTENFRKLFLPDMKAKGAIFKIGSGSEIALCEGYATGLSIYAAASRLNLNISVMCCFSASNIIEVAKTHGKYVLADHDESKKGEQAAEAAGLPYLMPDEVGMDWNDVHTKIGLMAVCKALMDVRRIKNNRAAG